jgi:hypothetical protein
MKNTNTENIKLENYDELFDSISKKANLSQNSQEKKERRFDTIRVKKQIVSISQAIIYNGVNSYWQILENTKIFYNAYDNLIQAQVKVPS